MRDIVIGIALVLAGLVAYLGFANGRLVADNNDLRSDNKVLITNLDNVTKLYDAKKLEMKLNEATMKRIEDEIKTIKKKLNSFKSGSSVRIPI